MELIEINGVDVGCGYGGLREVRRMGGSKGEGEGE